MISLKVFGQQAVMLFTLKQQTGSLLSQLKSMKAGEEQPVQPQQQQRAEPVTHTHTHTETTSDTDTDTGKAEKKGAEVVQYVDEFAEKHQIENETETIE